MTVTVRMYRGTDLRDGTDSLFAVDQVGTIYPSFYYQDSKWLIPEEFNLQEYFPIVNSDDALVYRESLKHMICIWEHDYDD